MTFEEEINKLTEWAIEESGKIRDKYPHQPYTMDYSCEEEYIEIEALNKEFKRKANGLQIRYGERYR